MQRKQPDTLSKSIGIASVTTFFMHPARVALNRASFHTSPIATLVDAFGYLFKGASLNIIRGGLSTGLQSFANDSALAYYNNSIFGKLAGLIAASITGTAVATLVETPFMRKTAASHLNLSMLYKYNLPITTYFLLREFGFSGAVLASKDLPPTAHYSILLTAAWLTASCHKLAMIEATKDLATHTFTVPDYTKGIRQVIHNIATGSYTHPALRVPITNPATFLQRSANVMYATCGPNMFFFRLLYLKGFTEARVLVKKYAENKEIKCRG